MSKENQEEEMKDINAYEAPELKPSWKNAPSATDLEDDLIEAMPFHNDMVVRVEHWLDVLKGTSEKVEKPNPELKVKTRSTYVAKLVRKQCEWRYPSLSEPFLSSPDLFEAKPMTYADELAAKQNSLLLNYQFNNRINKVQFFDTYVRAAVNNGTVIVKTLWKEKKKKVKKELPVFDFVEASTPEEEAAFAYWIDLFENDPDRFEQLVPEEWEEAINIAMESDKIVYPVKVRTQTEEVVEVIANHPVLEVCNFRNVVIDPTCKGKIEDAKFIIHMFETCLADLKADGRYKNLEYIDVASAAPIVSLDNYSSKISGNFNFKDDARKKIVAYEYWGFRDVDGSGLLTAVVATWVGKVLIQLEESPYQDEGLPFVVVPYMPEEESVYGEADAELLEDNQKVISAVQRGAIDLMGRSANAQTGYRKDALDIVNKRKFVNGEDFEFNPNSDPTTAFIQFKYPEIPQSVEATVQRHTQEAEALTGVKSFSNGITGASVGNTATGVRSAMDATAKRDSDILRRLAAGVVQIGRKIMAMNAMFLDTEEVIRITDTDYVPIKKDDLAGNMDLRLTISTAEADNQRAGELSFMLQTSAQFLGPGLTKIFMAEIARLRKMPEFARRIEQYQEAPDPLTQRKAELEVQLLEAQIQETLAAAGKKQADADNAPAIAQTELAKQRKLSSEADLNDLDFVEQEKGVKQARTLEASQAQAKGNIELEKVKAELNPKPTPKQGK